MTEMLKDHVAVIGSLNLNFGLIVRTWLNWRSGGALMWKVEAIGWEGQGVVCWLRTDGLAPASKY
jgi:hypothetical protein